MSKVLVTEDYLTDIADAIRAKNGSSGTYTPHQMAAAIAAIPTGVDVEALSVTQNGTYTAPTGKAYSPVTVNVSGGGGGAADILTQSNWLITQPKDSTGLLVCISKGLTSTNYTPPINSDTSPAITWAEWLTLVKSNLFAGIEHYGNIDNNFITGAGLVLLGNFKNGGAATGNVLTDSILNYSAIILNGIFKEQNTSQWSTSIVYRSPQLNTPYWSGMKDRASSYDNYTTFTDAQTVSLSGYMETMIYGVP